MKIRNIKNFGKHLIEVIALIPDEAPVELHKQLAEDIEEMMHKIRKPDNKEEDDSISG